MARKLLHWGGGRFYCRNGRTPRACHMGLADVLKGVVAVCPPSCSLLHQPLHQVAAQQAGAAALKACSNNDVHQLSTNCTRAENPRGGATSGKTPARNRDKPRQTATIPGTQAVRARTFDRKIEAITMRGEFAGPKRYLAQSSRLIAQGCSLADVCQSCQKWGEQRKKLPRHRSLAALELRRARRCVPSAAKPRGGTDLGRKLPPDLAPIGHRGGPEIEVIRVARNRPSRQAGTRRALHAPP